MFVAAFQFMIVYGGSKRVASTTDLIAKLSDSLRGSARFGKSPQSSVSAPAEPTRVLIELGELVQGILDHEFHKDGQDVWGGVQKACGEALLNCGRLFLSSNSSALEHLRNLRRNLEILSGFALPDRVTIHVPEGYAYYAVYPELYAEAAARLTISSHQGFSVIGLRSIGTSLAGLVAAALGASVLPVTLRPTGNPFERRLKISESLEAKLMAGAHQLVYAIVDEGPGLSGSSFRSVCHWLQERGVSRSRVVLFPSHPGEPGPSVSEEHRSQWRGFRKAVVTFEEYFDHQLRRCEDISGGRWRKKLLANSKSWPASFPQQERRKYLFTDGAKTYLAKFSGIGRYGEDKLARANLFAEAGFAPEVMGYHSGFILMRWHEDAVPCGEEIVKRHRESLVVSVGKYLAMIRQQYRSADDLTGASIRELFGMAAANSREKFGNAFDRGLKRIEALIENVAGAVVRTATDNKMHAWEWIRLPGGRFLKTDGLDHHSSHDIVGCQDIAWDIVAAKIELRLTDSEFEKVLAFADPGGPRGNGFSSEKERFFSVTYLAFQMGYFSNAARCMTHDPEEEARLQRTSDRYARRLADRLR
ncbi:MAG: hypothetical protein A2428_15020 [Bdellovibrionales bacterium RIFOXYC1_FULL_54_43]|nr:MAG: hypothetical protein A2428_15020 [Bdellovibrionales bacterium RIFOXYC1_FULL_54_43]OFZ82294.1 MAG: hypothetical protein A2603_01245 [Bdellovibrionales bacterium RIFOXYD1_FULL_55_31]